MRHLATAGLAALFLSGTSMSASADCAADIENARTAFQETLANATKPGVKREEDVPKNEPPGYVASGGTATNLPGDGAAKADLPADGQAQPPGQAPAAQTAAPAADAQAPAGGAQDAAANQQVAAGQAAPAQAPSPDQGALANAPAAGAGPAPSGQPAQEAQQQAEAAEPQQDAQRAAEAPATPAADQVSQGTQEQASSEPTVAQVSQADRQEQDGNPPSSGDPKGNKTEESEADLQREKPVLGLALMDLNHAEAYAAAGNEEACMQSLAKVEDTLSAWRSGS